jgi:mono/diheme cytochrome c family protein
MKRVVWIALGLVPLAIAGAWLFVPREVRIDATDRTAVVRGEALYARHCAACHGRNLEGQPDWQSRNAQGKLPAPPHDEHGHARHAPPGYQSDMPAFEGTLSDKDIVDVLAFIKSRWPALILDKRREAGMN